MAEGSGGGIRRLVIAAGAAVSAGLLIAASAVGLKSGGNETSPAGSTGTAPATADPAPTITTGATPTTIALADGTTTVVATAGAAAARTATNSSVGAAVIGAGVAAPKPELLYITDPDGLYLKINIPVGADTPMEGTRAVRAKIGDAVADVGQSQGVGFEQNEPVLANGILTIALRTNSSADPSENQIGAQVVVGLLQDKLRATGLNVEVHENTGARASFSTAGVQLEAPAKTASSEVNR